MEGRTESGLGGIRWGRREAQIERLERWQEDKCTEIEIKKQEAGEGGGIVSSPLYSAARLKDS